MRNFKNYNSFNKLIFLHLPNEFSNISIFFYVTIAKKRTAFQVKYEYYSKICVQKDLLPSQNCLDSTFILS